MPTNITALLGLLLSSLHVPLDYMLFQWACGLFLLAVLSGIYIARHTDWWCGTAFIYTAFEAFYFTLFRYSPYAYLKTDVRLSFISTATLCVLGLLLISVALIQLNKNQLQSIKWAILPFTALNAFYVILGWFFGFGREGMNGSNGFPGFLDYPGMNGCFLASSISFCVFDYENIKKEPVRKFLSFILIIGAIVLSKSAIPFGVLCVALISYYFAQRKLDPIKVIIALLALGLGYLVVQNKMFDSSMRIQAYEFFMKGWLLDNRYFIGNGPGSFPVFGPAYQMQHHFMPDEKGGVWAWYFLHSDWLQSIYEGGLILFTLVLGIFLKTAKRLYEENEAELFSLFLSLGAAAVFDYPIRYFIGSFLLSFCVVYSFKFKSSAG